MPAWVVAQLVSPRLGIRPAGATAALPSRSYAVCMVSDHQKKLLHEAVLLADTRQRYWARTAALYRSWEEWLAVLALVATSGAFLSIASELGFWWERGTALSAVVLTAIPVALRLGDRASRCLKLQAIYYRQMMDLDDLQVRVRSGKFETFESLAEELTPLLQRQDAAGVDAAGFLMSDRRIKAMQVRVMTSRGFKVPQVDNRGWLRRFFSRANRQTN